MLAGVLSVGVCAAMPAAASAASGWTAQVIGETLHVDGTLGQEDFEVRDFGGDEYLITEHNAGVPVAGSGCSSVGTAVICESAPITRIDVEARDGTDFIRVNDFASPEFSGVELVFHGGAGGDTLSAAPVTGALPVGVTLDGGTGIDTLNGASQADLLVGGPGGDILNGSGGEDVLRGDDGADSLNGGSSDDVLRGGESVDSLNGGSSEDILVGGEGDDTFRGGSSSDQEHGGEGGDNFIALLDADGDSINGGAGSDTISYAGRSTGVTVDIGAGGANDGSSFDGPAGARDEIHATVENLTGTGSNDLLTGNDLDNLFTGLGGADIFTGLTGFDTVTYSDHGDPVTVVVDGTANDGSAADGPSGARDLVKTDIEGLIGGPAADTLKGGAAANLITGGLGADSLFGLGGVDTLNAFDGVADAVINCGNGTGETAIVDGLDPTPVSCS